MRLETTISETRREQLRGQQRELSQIEGPRHQNRNNTTGWFYKPDTLDVKPNTSGADTQGTAYASY